MSSFSAGGRSLASLVNVAQHQPRVAPAGLACSAVAPLVTGSLGHLCRCRLPPASQLQTPGCRQEGVTAQRRTQAVAQTDQELNPVSDTYRLEGSFLCSKDGIKQIYWVW